MMLLPVLLAVLYALPTALEAQTPRGWDEFKRTFQMYADSDGIVGASVLVMRDGKVIDRYDTGFADRAANRRIDPSTIYHWGSITKTLTAISIMQLRDRGRFSLDDKVVRYIPELRRIHDPYDMMDSITIRMLLSHSAGFQNSTWPYDDGRPWEPFEPTQWEQLVAMMPYQQLHFRPGSRYGYSNPAFIYLARIIEQLTGDPWESYVQKNIFAPLGLQHSYFRATPYYLAGDRSHNYFVVNDSASGRVVVKDNGADFDPGITVPNGGWNAPLTDLATYAAFLTNRPTSNTKAAGTGLYDVVLKRSSLEEMWQRGHIMGAEPSGTAMPRTTMGLSFFVIERDGRRLIGHTGSQAGFRSFLYFNPATSTAIIASFNTTNYARPATALYTRMHDAALELLW